MYKEFLFNMCLFYICFVFVCVCARMRVCACACENLLVNHGMPMEVREQSAEVKFFFSTVCFTELNINTCYQSWKQEPIPIEYIMWFVIWSFLVPKSTDKYHFQYNVSICFIFHLDHEGPKLNWNQQRRSKRKVEGLHLRVRPGK